MSDISVIITCKNYGKYLDQAINSVNAQSRFVKEIYVIDDNSTDNTVEVATKYKYVDYIKTDGIGLAACCNKGLFSTTGDYVMRLDADDWLHQDAIQIMAMHLDANPDMDAVYSNFFLTKEDGAVGELGANVNGNPHPACMLIRRRVFEKLGGYNEELSYQEGYDFWLKFSKEHRAYHIELPLWYYRQHGGNMSCSWNQRHEVRQEIKDAHGVPGRRVLAVIPARGNSKGVPRKNLVELDGVPLVVHAIRMAKSCNHDMLIAVSTEDKEIAAVAESEGVKVIDRPGHLSNDNVSTIPVTIDAMKQMDASGWKADIVVTIQPTAPFTPSTALESALNQIMEPELDEVDCIVSVSEVSKHPYRCYRMFSDGALEPYFPENSEKYLQRQDRPNAYGFTGGFYVRKRELLDTWNGRDFAIGKVSGVKVSDDQSLDIDTAFDILVAKTIIQKEEV